MAQVDTNKLNLNFFTDLHLFKNEVSASASRMTQGCMKLGTLTYWPMKLADYDTISPNHTTRIDNCEATSVTIRSCCPMPNYQQVARESRGNPTDKVKGNFIRVGTGQGIPMYVKDISVLTT